MRPSQCLKVDLVKKYSGKLELFETNLETNVCFLIG